ncbi:MAG: alpha/beta fold hydrolase [Myxococcales bacterium]|nr:alpha/beta fold hydrolase [Myxococcales bacterium]
MKSSITRGALLAFSFAACAPPAPPAPMDAAADAPADAAVDAVISSSIVWAPCATGGLQCASVEVPRDYAQPEGPKMRLALARRPATAPDRIGTIVVEPGGPGISAVAWLPTNRIASQLRRFDIVAFDRRGTGGSEPLRCMAPADFARFARIDLAPDSPAERDEVLALQRAFVQGCAEYGDRLRFLDTRTEARDIESIRVALGEPTLSLVGFSYGSHVMALYNESFPDRVRAMVLDGVVDPSVDHLGELEGQFEGVDRALATLFDDCDRRRNCAFAQNESAGVAFDRIMRGLDTNPIPASNGVTLSPSLAWYGVSGLLYLRLSWLLAIEALSFANNGAGEHLEIYGITYLTAGGTDPSNPDSNNYSVYLATHCADGSYPPTIEAFEQRTARFATRAPRAGAANRLTDVGCVFWPHRPSIQPARLSVRPQQTALLVATTNDLATPAANARSVAAQLQNARVLERDDYGHVAYGRSACVTARVNAYLETLALPPPDTRCTP